MFVGGSSTMIRKRPTGSAPAHDHVKENVNDSTIQIKAPDYGRQITSLNIIVPIPMDLLKSSAHLGHHRHSHSDLTLQSQEVFPCSQQ